MKRLWSLALAFLTLATVDGQDTTLLIKDTSFIERDIPSSIPGVLTFLMDTSVIEQDSTSYNLVTPTRSQDDLLYKLRLTVPAFEAPGNYTIPHKYPSMDQALEYSNDLYELAFWGIDEAGDALFQTPGLKNKAFKYLVSLAFAKYASELPIPLGVWAHEEYHRSVLATNDIKSENGNWLFTRWDGTVFGVSDSSITMLKRDNLNKLLFAYTSGLQYHANASEQITIRDFYKPRSHYKNALLLYNAYYIYDYFSFSTSAKSDSVKVNAPDEESKNPLQRDFAGSDLTSWVFDMFNPETPFTARESFPGGQGVNRRIGFSDLSVEAQDYLKKQKKLSLLNFVNPAIFFINRIEISDDFSFNIFTQYVPTHFGNDIALYVPFTLSRYNFLVNLHRYSNNTGNGMGFGAGIFNFRISSKIESDLRVNFWDQPDSFFTDNKTTGGYINLESRYAINEKLSAFLALDGKSDGWMLGESELDGGASIQVGLNYTLTK